jgi:FixJ family two-component response regulator
VYASDELGAGAGAGIQGNEFPMLARVTLPDVPIILMSGSSEDALSGAAELNSAFPLLQKPGSRKELLQAIDVAVQTRHALAARWIAGHMVYHLT